METPSPQQSNTPTLCRDDLATRQAEFQKWVREVRDPASAASEGIRRIVVRDALAEYAIAPLPNGQWALRWGLEYHTGDCRGHHTPWTVHPSREHGIATFVEAARRHFGARLVGVAEGVTTQETAQKAILQQLRGDGLFGFMEPDVNQADSRTRPSQ